MAARAVGLPAEAARLDLDIFDVGLPGADHAAVAMATGVAFAGGSDVPDPGELGFWLVIRLGR